MVRLNCALSSVDRASVFGTEGRGFESLRARFGRETKSLGFLPLGIAKRVPPGV